MKATIDNLMEIQKTIDLSKVELSVRNGIFSFFNLVAMAHKDIGIKEWCSHSKPFQETVETNINLINKLTEENKIVFTENRSKLAV